MESEMEDESGEVEISNENEKMESSSENSVDEGLKGLEDKEQEQQIESILGKLKEDEKEDHGVAARKASDLEKANCVRVQKKIVDQFL